MIARTLARLAVRATLPLLAGALLITLGLGWAASKLVVHTAFDKLLPEGTEEVQDVHSVNDAVGGIGYVVAVIDGDDPQTVSDFADRFAERASALQDVRYVEHRFDASFFQDRALMLLSPEEIAELDESVAARIRREKEKANPLIVDLLDEEDRVEPPTLEELEARYRGRAPSRSRYLSEDGRTAYVMIKPTGLSGDLAFGQRFVPTVEALAAEMGATTEPEAAPTDAPAGVRVGLTGNYVVRVQENQVMLRDLRVAALLALFLSVGLVTLWTRRIRAVVLVGAPLLAGVLWTGGIVALVVEEVNIITGFLIAILFGLGIDFGIHLFMRFMEEQRAGNDVEQALERAIAVTGRATATGATTTAFAFAGLSIAEFEGFSQFGMVAAAGVMVAFVATYLTAPPVYAFLDRLAPAVRSHRIREERPFFSHARPRLIAWGLVLGLSVFAVFSALSLSEIEFVSDFRKLQGKLHATELQYRATADLEMTLAPALVMTRGMENARKVSAAIHAVDEAGGEESPIGLLLTLPDLVPADQEARVAAMQSLRKTLEDPAVETLGEEERQEVADALKSTEVKPYGVEDLPEYARNRFLGADGEMVLALIAPREPPYKTSILFAWADALAAIKKQAGEVELYVADENRIAARILRLIIADGPVVVSVAVAAVFILLLIDLRHPGRALLVLAPLLLGLLSLAGLMRLFGVHLNFLNSVMVPSIVGIGIDNAVHIYHRYRDEGPGSIGLVVRHTGSAAFLATTTTAIGFGTLVIAHHGGLRSVGSLALLGMLSTFVATTLFFPSLLWIVERLTHQVPDDSEGD